MQPYTYLIGWPKLNTYYYGVRYSKKCDPSDFWITYFTSSKKVKEFVIKHGEPTVKQIRKVFNNELSARLWEHRVLKRINVVGTDQWLNTHYSMAPYLQKGDQHWARIDPEKAKRALGGKNNYIHTQPGALEKRQERMRTDNPASRPEVQEKIRQGQLALGENHPMKRPEERARVSVTSKENWTDDRKAEQATRMRLRWQDTRFKKIKCPHCEKMIGANNYKRYHGDNCKSNLTSLVANTDSRVYNQL
jgi:hypothetical protein